MTHTTSRKHVAIMGAGLAGTLMSIYLARRGWRVDVFERRPDLRTTPVRGSRSINMTLALRGIAALEKVLDINKIIELTIPLEGRLVHNVDRTVDFHPYGITHNEVIYAVTRSRLNARLLDIAATYPNIKLWFNHSCVKIDKEKWKVTVLNEESQEKRDIVADFVVGADGTYSAVRQQMHHGEICSFRQDYLESGYIELVFAADAGGAFKMPTYGLHLWPRGRSMLMAIPNLDGTFASNCILPFHGPESFAELDSPSKVMRFFATQFPDAVEMINGLPGSFHRNPPAGFPTTRVWPWCYKDRIVLIGDACHTVVPFYGLGMNAAFEDCAVLDACISKHPESLAQAFQEYQRLRKVNTDVLADLSIGNFLELRDRVRLYRLTARKRIMAAGHRMFPKSVVPLYTMMSHTTIPFAEALSRSKRQDRIARLLGMDLMVEGMAGFLVCRNAVQRLLRTSRKPGDAVLPKPDAAAQTGRSDVRAMPGKVSERAVGQNTVR